MKTSITPAQVAVLELKRQRAEKALQQLDDLHSQIVALLEIDEGIEEQARGIGTGAAADYVEDFLSGDQEPRRLCELLGIEVRA